MSLHFICNECGNTISDYGRRIQVRNLCLPHGIMKAQDLDFCDAPCFWAWVRRWVNEVPKSEIASLKGD